MKKTFQITEKVALLIFVVWALFLSFEYWGFGPASYVKIPDAADSMLASRLALNSDIRDRELSNWNPNLLAGVDRTAQGESLGVLDALFMLLPGWLAYGALMFIQRFVAGYFTYKVLTKHLGVAPLLALFPAFFFSLFSQNQINLQFDGFTVYDGLGSPALPMMLYALGFLAADKKKRIWLTAFLAFGFGLVISSASSFVLTIFFFPVIVFWLLVIYPGWQRSSWIIFGAFVLGWLVLETPEIIATFLLSPDSQRSLRESCTGVAVTSFASLPNFLSYYIFKYDNYPALLVGLAGLAVWKPKHSNRKVIAILGLLLSYIFLSFYLPGIVCSANNPIGFVKGFNYSRFYFYLPFIICVFSGAGLQNLINYFQAEFPKNKPAKRLLPGLVTVVLLAFVLYLAVGVKQDTFRARVGGSNYTNLYANPYLQILAEKIAATDPHARAVMLVDANSTFQIHPAYLWPYGINTLDGYTGIYTLKFSQFWAAVINPMMQLYPECRYGILFQRGSNRVSLNNHCDIQGIDLRKAERLFDLDLLSIAGVRYFISTVELETPDLDQIDTSAIVCPQIFQTCTQYYIYENKNALPFAFSFSDVVSKPLDEKVLNTLKQANIDQLTNQVFVNSLDVFGVPINGIKHSEDRLDVVNYSSDHVEIEFSSSTPKILMINWVYSDNWQIRIDGLDVQPFPVDFIFLGIYLPQGQHLIELKYLPQYSFSYWMERASRLIQNK